MIEVAPLRPELEIHTRPRGGSFEIDEQFHARCISRDGRPPAQIQWFLDDEPILEGLSAAEIVESTAANNATLYSVTQTITRVLRASDDRKHLICRTAHPADHGMPQETQYQLQVRCKCFLSLEHIHFKK